VPPSVLFFGHKPPCPLLRIKKGVSLNQKAKLQKLCQFTVLLIILNSLFQSIVNATLIRSIFLTGPIAMGTRVKNVAKEQHKKEKNKPQSGYIVTNSTITAHFFRPIYFSYKTLQVLPR
jgi:hypothetical protein